MLHLAAVQVPCSGESHTLAVFDSHTECLDHDPEAERIAASFGSPPPLCHQIRDHGNGDPLLVLTAAAAARLAFLAGGSPTDWRSWLSALTDYYRWFAKSPASAALTADAVLTAERWACDAGWGSVRTWLENGVFSPETADAYEKAGVTATEVHEWRGVPAPEIQHWKDRELTGDTARTAVEIHASHTPTAEWCRRRRRRDLVVWQVARCVRKVVVYAATPLVFILNFGLPLLVLLHLSDPLPSIVGWYLFYTPFAVKVLLVQFNQLRSWSVPAPSPWTVRSTWVPRCKTERPPGWSGPLVGSQGADGLTQAFVVTA